MVKAWWACGYSLQGYNFGDAITPYLIEKFTGQAPMLASIYDTDPYYLVVGSIINPKWARSNSIIWGSGIIDKTQTAQKGATFLAVRGPETHKYITKSGHSCPEIFGDPGLLLPYFFKPSTEIKYKVGIIPHYIDNHFFKKSEEFKIIDLTKPDIEDTVRQICNCEFIVSSSLHGVIVSQAYGIPAVWVKFSNKLSGDGIKFRDYFLSVGIKPYEYALDLGEDPIKTISNNLKKIKNFPNEIYDFDILPLIKSCPFNE